MREDKYRSMGLGSWARCLGVVLACALSVGTAHAVAQAPVAPAANCGENFCDYFEFNTDYAISDIVRFNVDNGSTGGLGWSFSVNAGYSSDDLDYGSSAGVNNIFFMGVATGVGGDDAPHLVLLTNNAFAAAASGVDWSSIFRNTSEAALITDLQTSFAPGTDATSAALDDLFNFGYGSGDAVTNPLGAIAFHPGDGFSVIAFSNGTQIGSGVSFEVASVPEPASLALALAGLSVGGAMWRRRRQA